LLIHPREQLASAVHTLQSEGHCQNSLPSSSNCITRAWNFSHDEELQTTMNNLSAQLEQVK
jgi:hypothetical protein